jgi:hypothetical protein
MQPAFTATMLAGISPMNVPRTNCLPKNTKAYLLLSSAYRR